MFDVGMRTAPSFVNTQRLSPQRVNEHVEYKPNNCGSRAPSEAVGNSTVIPLPQSLLEFWQWFKFKETNSQSLSIRTYSSQ